MKRVGNFEHSDGDVATEAPLATALKPWARQLVDANVNLYASLDMKVGVCHDTLVKHAVLLTALMSVDKRGGFFFAEGARQCHCEIGRVRRLE